MVGLLKEYGTDRMLVNSAADWGRSDPLKTARTGAAMLAAGFHEDDVDRVLWRNPVAFYGQSGRLDLAESGAEELTFAGQLGAARHPEGALTCDCGTPTAPSCTWPTARTCTRPRTSTAWSSQLGRYAEPVRERLGAGTARRGPVAGARRGAARWPTRPRSGGCARS